ncbi:MAG: ABC transporter substrate-binding protein [Candidatus Bathyarchaeota archaeon]|nr:ABC transporter substrate-binding protein [Candidatus Bathyarchaeota archaeon]
MFNSVALTKFHSIILVAVIAVSSVVAGTVYVFLTQEPQQTQTIKIGVCADLDELGGKDVWEGAVLAAEQVNAEGGVLGRYLEIVGEDTDEAAPIVDMIKVSTALTRLITFHKVDYVIGGFRDDAMLMMQDIIAEHKIIFLSLAAGGEALTQRVLDDYSRYKYYFRVTPPNSTAIFREILDSLVVLREYTGFNKIAYLVEDRIWTESIRAGLDYYLPEVYNFDIVYRGQFTTGTTDFTSYFAAAEAAGTEILIPLIGAQDSIFAIKEWYDRQSPFVVWGVDVTAQANEYWEWTDGKCGSTTTMVSPFVAGYPWTNKTLPVRTDFIDRWGHSPTFLVHGAYDTVRYILPDAIERAGTIETDAVIEAVEETALETTDSPRFMFTSSHDLMFGPGYTQALFFQWQADGARVPVYPKEIMEEAGATYMFPDWPGPWD